MSEASVVVAVDVMGGDHAPHATVLGALQAAGPDVEVLLVGDEAVVAPLLAAADVPGRAHARVLHAPDKVHSHEDGARAVRAKPDSSVVRACREVREGRAHAAVSLGHTGAMMAAATLHIRRIPGVIRPGIAVVLPSRRGFLVLVDAGANADARPEHLLQFALMGRLFAQAVLGIPEPRIGLLSIGEEEERGSELVQAAHALLRGTPGFAGNVEGRDIPRGTVDVVVTDGFTGNVALKLYEASGEFLLSELRAAATSSLPAKIGGLLLRPAVRRMRHRIDPDLYGGAVLMGVNGLAIIGHGSSNEEAVANAVRAAARAARERVVDRVAEAIAHPGQPAPA
ncbi:MAG TPA: phosphate acyltransferase PlsX [Miltoncostaeaceae bacterium]|nr:phosphate acyltransferase PlsX [Miltoncostaeaceae bacterium]